LKSTSEQRRAEHQEEYDDVRSQHPVGWCSHQRGGVAGQAADFACGCRFQLLSFAEWLFCREHHRRALTTCEAFAEQHGSCLGRERAA
jgi:hypothetical protein